MSPGALASAVLALVGAEVDGFAAVSDEGGAGGVPAVAALVGDAADVPPAVDALLAGVRGEVDDDVEEQAAATTTAAVAHPARHVIITGATGRAVGLRATWTEQSDGKLTDQIAGR